MQGLVVKSLLHGPAQPAHETDQTQMGLGLCKGMIPTSRGLSVTRVSTLLQIVPSAMHLILEHWAHHKSHEWNPTTNEGCHYPQVKMQ